MFAGTLVHFQTRFPFFLSQVPSYRRLLGEEVQEEGIGRDSVPISAWRIYGDALRYCKFTVFERLGASNSNP